MHGKRKAIRTSSNVAAGVNATIDYTVHNTTNLDPPFSALIALSNVSLTLVDTVFTDLNLTDVHAPLSLHNSSIFITNSTFRNNTAPLAGSIAGSDVNLTLDNSTFNNNYGGEVELCQAMLLHLMLTLS